MFTGLVECVGEVLSLARRSSGVHVLRVSAPGIASEVRRGESVAVAGACLTAVSASRDFFEAEMMEETLRSTRLGALKPGDRVNLERALRVGARLDGHLVAGHVDEVGTVARIEESGDTRKCWVTASPAIAGFIAGKGSVALDGVSLTVIDVLDVPGDAGGKGGRFSVGLIPTTLRETTVGGLRAGDPVNIEADMIARYTARLMRFGAGDEPVRDGVTWGKLQEHGWI